MANTGGRGFEAVEGEWTAASVQVQRTTGFYAVFGFVFILVLCIPVAWLANAIATGPSHYLVFAGLMTVVFGPIVLFMYRSTSRDQQRSHDLAVQLQHDLLEAVQTAERESGRREVQVHRQEFETQLANALEMADGEADVLDVVERALASTLPDAPAEMLLADNSHAHLARVAISSPDGDPPACPVDSPDQCPAARRAQVQRFDDSDALDACPKLRDRVLGRCSAACVPISIMGRAVGVLHTTGVPDQVLDDNRIQDLATLANLAGARIGLLRMMAETQLQAATDTLTGLLNRRTLEKRVIALRQTATPFTLVMADLDRFKDLNDTFGHETGDRALRLFARTLTTTLRKEDIVCRHGGEEFAVILPGCAGVEARTACDTVRARLAEAIAGAGVPDFTASFGAVEAGDHEDLADLIGRADGALFEAKHRGRDRVVIHDSNGAAIDTSPVAAARARNGLSATQNGGAPPSVRVESDP